MASSMLSTAAVASVNRGTKIQASLAPCNGLSSAMFSTFKTKSYIPSSSSNKGFRINCMQVWPPNGNKKFETLSYLPTLSTAALAKEVDYLLRNGWVPCLEFDLKGFVFRDGHKSPGYYDGRYWTMWKLPMFGCTDSSQVIKEVGECKKAYPEAFVRIIGFDNKRQVQCISFIASKPDGY